MGEISQEFIFFKKKKRSNENNPTPTPDTVFESYFSPNHWYRTTFILGGELFCYAHVSFRGGKSIELLQKKLSLQCLLNFCARWAVLPSTLGSSSVRLSARYLLAFPQWTEEEGGVKKKLESPPSSSSSSSLVLPPSSPSVASKPRGESAQNKKKTGKRKGEGGATLNYRGQQFPLAGFCFFRGSSKVGKWGSNCLIFPHLIARPPSSATGHW